jgi:hypothetical protein
LLYSAKILETYRYWLIIARKFACFESSLIVVQIVMLEKLNCILSKSATRPYIYEYKCRCVHTHLCTDPSGRQQSPETLNSPKWCLGAFHGLDLGRRTFPAARVEYPMSVIFTIVLPVASSKTSTFCGLTSPWTTSVSILDFHGRIQCGMTNHKHARSWWHFQYWHRFWAGHQ